MNKVLLRNMGITAVAWATVAVAAPLVVRDADFDRESQRIQLQMQSSEIVTETGSGPTSPSVGMAGRAADQALAGDQATDSGSRWFNSYVAQVNQQLRLRARAGAERDLQTE